MRGLMHLAAFLFVSSLHTERFLLCVCYSKWFCEWLMQIYFRLWLLVNCSRYRLRHMSAIHTSLFTLWLVSWDMWNYFCSRIGRPTKSIQGGHGNISGVKTHANKSSWVFNCTSMRRQQMKGVVTIICKYFGQDSSSSCSDYYVLQAFVILFIDLGSVFEVKSKIFIDFNGNRTGSVILRTCYIEPWICNDILILNVQSG